MKTIGTVFWYLHQLALALSSRYMFQNSFCCFFRMTHRSVFLHLLITLLNFQAFSSWLQDFPAVLYISTIFQKHSFHWNIQIKLKKHFINFTHEQKKFLSTAVDLILISFLFTHSLQCRHLQSTISTCHNQQF